ncbi:transmembrane amino acid transporter protein-domain-containing protein [Cantharellus anzutake]|uniref:transmembrane amino acid transporter protein-domain-containing protein n=1 Tax=Cantharellus anzutake TaxID=1750568 RepID=UPI00190787A5|nr:transmembrane amino acid transporter protein-domain-containing protein [Cantharellus anzutake]KAF8342961.1 transmembrane amino acid transporter protein-domain-containing protein [Cantharellus anzutake]
MDIPSSFRSTRATVVEGLLSYGRSQSFISGSPLHHQRQNDDECDSNDEEDNDVEEVNDSEPGIEDDHDVLDFFPQLQVPGYDHPSQTAGVLVSPASSRHTGPGLIPVTYEGTRYSSLPVDSGPSVYLTQPQPDLQSATEVTERSPLLLRRSSIQFQNTLPVSSPPNASRLSETTTSGRRKSHSHGTLRRQNSVSLRERKVDSSAGSTYNQSLFNSTAVLLGVGILSEPYAFAQAGWVMGTLLTIGYGALACYTAKILGRMIVEDRRLKTYADCGKKAFGPRSAVITSTLFFVELFTVSLFILVPSAFLPLSVISYASLLSVVATLFVIVVVVIDGLSKYDTPGSLFEFAPTDVWPVSSMQLGLSFGLFMAGFAGHAVVPSIAQDMREPERFERMINTAFVVTTVIYGIIGVCGYLMFGRTVTDEISRDLLQTQGYNEALAKIGAWMLVVSPILESSPGRHLVSSNSDPENALLSSDTEGFYKGPLSRLFGLITAPAFLTALERTALTISIVAVAIAVPHFGVVLSILGAFSAFTLCIIGPLAAKLSIFETSFWERCFDYVLLALCIVMAGWGTFAAIMI